MYNVFTTFSDRLQHNNITFYIDVGHGWNGMCTKSRLLMHHCSGAIMWWDLQGKAKHPRRVGFSRFESDLK